MKGPASILNSKGLFATVTWIAVTFTASPGIMPARANMTSYYALQSEDPSIIPVRLAGVLCYDNGKPQVCW
jgi:hypothetical protein